MKKKKIKLLKKNEIKIHLSFGLLKEFKNINDTEHHFTNIKIK